MIDFSSSVLTIKNSFNKEQLKDFESIESYESLHLASMGSNDLEGYQIFTPDFIVKQMVEAIGDDVLDFNKTVLEPTSGDGAFTTYILRKRLETIKDNFEVESLKALSTIYSIEMDKELIIKQRNNIYTVIKLYALDNKIEVHESYFDIVKSIITTNFMWAMFVTDEQGPLLIEIAYKMPEAEQGKQIGLPFVVWTINMNQVTYVKEEVNLW